jgi:hypothetical protein
LTSLPCHLQTLKLLRYAAKLSLVSVLSGHDTPLAMQLRSFESSVGTTRWVHADTLGTSGQQLECDNVPVSWPEHAKTSVTKHGTMGKMFQAGPAGWVSNAGRH